jgi:hypothetical protein
VVDIASYSKRKSRDELEGYFALISEWLSMLSKDDLSDFAHKYKSSIMRRLVNGHWPSEIEQTVIEKYATGWQRCLEDAEKFQQREEEYPILLCHELTLISSILSMTTYLMG